MLTPLCVGAGVRVMRQADAAILVINATTGEFEAGAFHSHADEALLPLLNLPHETRRHERDGRL